MGTNWRMSIYSQFFVDKYFIYACVIGETPNSIKVCNAKVLPKKCAKNLGRHFDIICAFRCCSTFTVRLKIGNLKGVPLNCLHSVCSRIKNVLSKTSSTSMMSDVIGWLDIMFCDCSSFLLIHSLARLR